MSNSSLKRTNFRFTRNCPLCSAENILFDEKSRYVCCDSCIQIYDATFNRLFVAKQDVRKFKPLSFIKVGHRVDYENQVYYITGRSRHRSVFREFWKEESQEGYSNETWEYDCWIAQNNEGNKIFIIEDKEGYAISKPVKSDFPDVTVRSISKDYGVTSISRDAKKRRIQEYGVSELIFFEGESQEPQFISSKVLFAMYLEDPWKDHSPQISIEEGEGWREYYKEVKISRDVILRQLFAQNPRITNYEKRYDSYNAFKNSLAGIAVILMLLGFFSLFWDGNKLFETRVIPEDIKDDEDGWTSKPFEIKDIHKAYSLGWTADFPNTNSGMFAVIEILDQDANVINGFQTDFWDESGQDSEGSWRETGGSSTEYFKFEKEGYYFFRLYTEADSSYSSSFNTVGEAKPQGAITLSVYQDVMLSRYYFIISIVFFILFWIFEAKTSWREAYVLMGMK